jgi:hypothetical protein
MFRTFALAGFLALGCTSSLYAQASGPAASVEPSRAVDMVLSSYEKEFTDAAMAMPADKYDFAPRTSMIAGSKYDGVRTFAEQVKHVAQANFSYAAAASGLKPDFDVKGIAALKSKDEILQALAASFTFAHKAVATLTAQNAFEPVRSATRVTLATTIATHGMDHYGQMVEYLRMNGIIPPASAM